MASLGFGTVAAVTPLAAAAGRRRRRAASFARVVPAATRGGNAAAKEEKGFFDFVVGALYKEEQLLETDPVLNKVEEKATTSGTVSRKAGTVSKKADGNSGGGGFGIGGLFAKKG